MRDTSTVLSWTYCLLFAGISHEKWVLIAVLFCMINLTDVLVLLSVQIDIDNDTVEIRNLER